MIPVVLGITLLIFLLVRSSGDPAVLMLPEDASREQIEQFRIHLGLDKPLYEQYVRYMGNLAKGDFGESIRYRGQAALPVVLERLPATLELAGASLVVAVLISFPAGVIAAKRRNRWEDRTATWLSVAGQAMPNFWLGIMLILVFAVWFRWLPVSGRGGLQNLILPALTLGSGLAAVLTRLMRSSLLEVLSQDYVRTARAKGLAERTVLYKHSVRNALLSYITLIGVQVATLLAGAVVTEQVFAWPGIGLLAIQAIHSRDMAVVQTIVIITSIIVMLCNLIVDLLYAVVDPRIQYA